MNRLAIRAAALRLPAVFALLALCTAGAHALTAVVEVNESPYFLEKLGNYGGLTVTRAYAPMPVFFEGFESTPREDIVEYLWDFGDGSDSARGFNAAHVYETPGIYTTTLTVTDRFGAQSVATIDIEVLPRDGTTYYVDSVTGNDSNPGTSPSQAWRTATHAFIGMNEERYGPGDSILFNRGQTFDVQAGLVNPGHAASSYGYMFGTYGSGAKPLIQLIGTQGGFVIKHSGVGLGHFAMVDLHFDLTSSSGTTASLMTTIFDAENLLYLRLDIEDFRQAILGNGKVQNNVSGMFIIECNAHNSTWVQMWGLMSRFALVDSTFDQSENHVAYLAYIDRGVISGNTLSRPAFGRTALRLASRTDDFNFATNNVYIADNHFLGWIDPVVGGSAHADGTRYNWELINLAPNGPWDQRMTDVVFERNVATNAETLMTISDYDNLVVRNNLFVGKSTAVSPRIKIGKPGYDSKPLRNVKILGNTFVLQGANVGTNPVFGINEYVDEPYEGLTQHTGIQIKNNIIYVPFGKSRPIYFETNNPDLLAAVETDYNLYYTPNVFDGVFQVGGNFQGGGVLFDILNWQVFASEDFNSIFTDPLLLDIDGPDDDFAGDVFDENLDPREDSPAIDAGVDLVDMAYDFGSVRRPIGGAPDIGAIEQTTALSIIVVGQGTVDRAPGPPYMPDQDVTLTATPDPNWAFVGWSGDLVSTNPVEVVTLDDSKVITAEFEQVIFELDVSIFGQGSVSTSPNPPYSLNDVVTVTATPDSGQIFIDWTGDLVSTSAVDTITMDADKSILASFTKDEYFLNVSTIGAGSVSAAPPGPYSYLDGTSLTAAPDPGMLFHEWIGDFPGTANPLNITFENDYDVTARFVQIEYTVNTATVGNGSVTVTPAGPYSYLDAITVDAVPDPGWEFAGWTGTMTSSSEDLNFDIDADQTLTATFVPVEYNINANVVGRGSISLSPPGPYAPGTMVTIEAIPDFGWAFNTWGGNITGSVNPQTVPVNSDMFISANFIDIGAGLTIWASRGGSVLQDPAPPYDKGTTVVLNANPAPDYRFLGWSGDLSGSSEQVSIVLNANKTIGAHFGKDDTQSATVTMPFFLDVDGIGVPAGTGEKTFLTVRNGKNAEVDAKAFYTLQDGTDATPTFNDFTIGSLQSITYRPANFVSNPVYVPPMINGFAGGSRIDATNAGITGMVRMHLPGGAADHSAYMANTNLTSTTLAVPFFLDNDGYTMPVDGGTRSFIGVQNLDDSPNTIAITYRDANGNLRTPTSNTYILGPKQSVGFRPFVQEPQWEGEGANVPKMSGSIAAGSAYISGTGPIAGRFTTIVEGKDGGTSSYLLPDGFGSQELVVPYCLDNDGIQTPVDEGTRTFIAVQNLSTRTITIVLHYASGHGEDLTPADNEFSLAPYQSASWRPWGHEPPLEGPVGSSIPNALGNAPHGGVRIVAKGGRIAGRLAALRWGAQGAQSSFVLPSEGDSQTLVVPYFKDTAGVTFPRGQGEATYIGIMNTTPFTLPLTIRYFGFNGDDRSPTSNTFSLAPYQALGWRPVAFEPHTEGEGTSVPDMASGTAGSVEIHSPLGGIVGRAVQINGIDDFTHSAYQLPAQYDMPSTK